MQTLGIRALKTNPSALSKAFDKSKQGMLALLAHLGIALADYDREEDLETIRLVDGD